MDTNIFMQLHTYLHTYPAIIIHACILIYIYKERNESGRKELTAREVATIDSGARRISRTAPVAQRTLRKVRSLSTARRRGCRLLWLTVEVQGVLCGKKSSDITLKINVKITERFPQLGCVSDCIFYQFNEYKKLYTLISH